MELITENTPEINKEKDSVLTYCRSKIVKKTFVHVCNIHDFWTVYKVTSTFLLTIPNNEAMPFEILMKFDKKEEKVIFSIKDDSLRCKRVLYNILLQSSAGNNIYEIPKVHDNTNFELKISFLMQCGQEFISSDTLRVIFKFYSIETVLYSTIHTTLQHNEKKSTNLPTSDSNELFIFKTKDAEFSVKKNLVFAKSTYLKNWFNTNDQDTIFKIYIFPSDVVKLCVNFIQHDDTSTLKDVDVKKLIALHKMACKYDIINLPTICEHYIRQHLLLKADILGEYDALEILYFAYNKNIQKLLKLAVDFVALNSNDYMHTLRFAEITTSRPEIFNLLKEAEINTRSAFCNENFNVINI